MKTAVCYQQRIGELLSPVLHAITVHEKYIQMKIIGSREGKVRELWEESLSDKNKSLSQEDSELIRQVLRVIVSTRLSMRNIEIPIVSNAVWKYIGELYNSVQARIDSVQQDIIHRVPPSSLRDTYTRRSTQHDRTWS